MIGSFRDPSGRLFLFRDRALRLANQQGAAALLDFLSTDTAKNLTDSGRMVRTRVLDAVADSVSSHIPEIETQLKSCGGQILLEHDRIPVQSFPYEWPPEMLHAAGALTLDLADAALTENYLLKDATPYNVLFVDWHPVFVDVLSFERRDPRDPTWLAFNQFVQTFLLPLLVNKHYGLRLDQLLTMDRDGIEPAQVARLSGGLQKLSPLFLSLVSIPHWLNKQQPLEDAAVYEPKKTGDPQRARFILQHQLKRLRRQLAKVAPDAGATSDWSEYMTPNKYFSLEYLRAKESFVVQTLTEIKPRRVLDVGCNTGYFSALVARNGANVVAIDQDPEVVGALWRRAAAENLTILPLVVNLARPTPAVGWRNEECPSFLDRARGVFDTVLMLAVLHHMLVVEQIPLPAILELVAQLTSEYLVTEFVTPEDPMFQRLVRGRAELFAHVNRELFESTAKCWFQIVRVEDLQATRTIYLLRKRTGDSHA